jgi:hypothetical protein
VKYSKNVIILNKTPPSKGAMYMSASSNEFKAESAATPVDITDLKKLIDKLELVNSKYQSKSFLSFKSHSDALENILAQANAAFKAINDESLMLYNLSDSEKAQKMSGKIQNTYMEIVKKLEAKFDTGLESWEKSKKKYITDDMHQTTRYDMYNCAHLNADPEHHSSSRNIGLILQSAYIRLGDQEKIKCMQNLQGNKDSIESTVAPQPKQPEHRIVNQHDLNFTVGELKSILTEYQQKGRTSSKTHEKDIAKIIEVAEAELYAINIEDRNLATNPSLSHENRMVALRPRIKSAFDTIVQALQNQFDAGLTKWANDNKKIIRSDMSPSTRYDLYNCLHLNAEPKDHSSSRNIGMLLKSLYGKLDDREKMDCMRHLKSSIENHSPSPSSANKQ